MKAEFCSLEWKKSENEFVERKVGEKAPSGFVKEIRRDALKVVYMIPGKNQYILTVKAEDGKLYEEDVYGIIKYYDSSVRITKNFRIKFEAFMAMQQYVVDERNFIRNLYPSVESFIKTMRR